ncbi:MAG: hypothetical protein WBD47_09045 [Phormidesmis sp.]
MIRFLVPSFPLGDVLYSKFSVSKEQSFPTLYSSLALAFCSGLLWVIKRFKERVRDRYIRHWRFLSFTFLYLAIDEMLSIHEKASEPLHKLGVNGVLHNAWLLPASIVVLIFGLSFLGFLFHLPKAIRRLVLFAFCTFIAGAGVVELLGGYYAFLYGREGIVYALVTTVEEACEMLGIVAFIYALLLYMRKIGIRQIELRGKL